MSVHFSPCYFFVDEGMDYLEFDYEDYDDTEEEDFEEASEDEDEGEDDGEDETDSEDEDDAEEESEDSEDEESEDSDDECEELGIPTAKRRKLANEEALKLSLSSGLYPQYLGIEGPFMPRDPTSFDALDFLKLMWPEALCELIVVETNRYAAQKKAKNWVDIDIDELWAFMGITTAMSIHRLPEIRNYWSRDDFLRVECIKRRMTVNRFFAIRSYLHVVDNSLLSPRDGLSKKIEPIIKTLEETFFHNYSPAQELCCDEAMCKCKGHVVGIVVMPKKPIRKGFKIWCCCCACCGYLCSFRLYEGKPIDPITGKRVPEKGLIKKVVKDLLSLFTGLNHVVYCDNYYTSGPLVEELVKDKIYLAGTIQQRAAGFPDSLKKIKLSKGSYATDIVGDVRYFVFHDRKVVSFVTNVFPAHMKGKVARVQPGGALRYQSVPPVLPAYNKFMGGVDRLSQLRKSYGYDRKAKRYWLRCFFQLWDYAITNAYILYKHNCKHFRIAEKKQQSQLDFRLELVQLLLKETRGRNRSSSSSSTGPVCSLQSVAAIGLSRGRCHHCLRMNRRPVPHTSFGCASCKVRLCKTQCFTDYHL